MSAPTGPANRSPATVARIRVQNRRREYLHRHPSYCENMEHELADPVTYERLVKRFQSSEERAKDGKAKGYGRTLEASLIRGETTLANLRAEGQANGSPAAPTSLQADGGDGIEDEPTSVPTGLDAWDGPAQDKEEGLELWRAFLQDRFVHGRDDEFDYSLVDDDEGYDVLESKDAEDRWFDDEEPSWVEDGEEALTGREDARTGETGIQDF